MVKILSFVNKHLGLLSGIYLPICSAVALRSSACGLAVKAEADTQVNEERARME